MVGQSLVSSQRRGSGDRPAPQSRTPGPGPDHRAAPVLRQDLIPLGWRRAVL